MDLPFNYLGEKKMLLKINLHSMIMVRLIKSLIVIASVLLAACGGGGGSAGTCTGASCGTSSSSSSSGSSSTAASIEITLTDQNGNVTTSVSTTKPGKISAKVKDASGSPVVNTLVTFSASAFTIISPSTKTQITDSSGIASVSIQPSRSDGGADDITVSASINGVDVTNHLAYSFSASSNVVVQASSIEAVSVTPSDKSIVIKGAGGNGRSETATLVFKVKDSSGQPVANKDVTFSVQSSNPVTLVTTSSKSNADGQVTAIVNSGTLPTSVTVTAKVTESPTIFANVTSLAVTTGSAVQQNFSLSAEKFNIEGYLYDGITTKLTARIADQNGNPIADGAPVTFQTNSAAVGSSSIGGCFVLNGACSVDFTSQEYRFRSGSEAGIATVTASITTGGNTLSGVLRMVLSGSFGQAYPINGSGVRQSVVNNTINLGTDTACTGLAFDFELADDLDNPMPADTAIITQDSVNGLGGSAIFPDKVPNASVASGATHRGTFHSVLMSSSNCKVGGAASAVGSINLVFTTPKGNKSFTRVQMTYPKDP